MTIARPSNAELLEAQRLGVTVYALRQQRGARIAPTLRLAPDIPLAQLTRDGDSLAGTIWIAPRTKKNSQKICYRTIGGKTTPFIRQSETAIGFAHDVVAAILPHKVRLGLPLPDREYSLSTVFYTDNKAPDVVGLLQALQDALQAAHVVTNDRQFNPIERSLRVYQPHDARITFTIRPAS